MVSELSPQPLSDGGANLSEDAESRKGGVNVRPSGESHIDKLMGGRWVVKQQASITIKMRFKSVRAKGCPKRTIS